MTSVIVLDIGEKTMSDMNDAALEAIEDYLQDTTYLGFSRKPKEVDVKKIEKTYLILRDKDGAMAVYQIEKDGTPWRNDFWPREIIEEYGTNPYPEESV